MNFAYGDWSFGDTKCPARCAGMGGVNSFTDIYDKVVQEMKDEDTGVIPEEEAKKAWFEAMDRTDDPYKLDFAQEVADRLDWEHMEVAA